MLRSDQNYEKLPNASIFLISIASRTLAKYCEYSVKLNTQIMYLKTELVYLKIDLVYLKTEYLKTKSCYLKTKYLCTSSFEPQTCV